jgi:hypothetical protein
MGEQVCVVQGCGRPAAGWSSPDSPWRSDGGRGRGHGVLRRECAEHVEVGVVARTDPFRAELMRQRLRSGRS